MYFIFYPDSDICKPSCVVYLTYLPVLSVCFLISPLMKMYKARVFKQIFKQEEKSAHGEGNSAFLIQTVI